jgi:hypothetical protein
MKGRKNMKWQKFGTHTCPKALRPTLGLFWLPLFAIKCLIQVPGLAIGLDSLMIKKFGYHSMAYMNCGLRAVKWWLKSGLVTTKPICQKAINGDQKVVRSLLNHYVKWWLKTIKIGLVTTKPLCQMSIEGDQNRFGCHKTIMSYGDWRWPK